MPTSYYYYTTTILPLRFICVTVRSFVFRINRHIPTASLCLWCCDCDNAIFLPEVYMSEIIYHHKYSCTKIRGSYQPHINPKIQPDPVQSSTIIVQSRPFSSFSFSSLFSQVLVLYATIYAVFLYRSVNRTNQTSILLIPILVIILFREHGSPHKKYLPIYILQLHQAIRLFLKDSQGSCLKGK